MTRPRAPLRPAPPPDFPRPGRRDASRAGCARSAERGLRERVRRRDAGAPGAPRLRARRDPLDGLRRLLPDRRPTSSASRASRGSRRPAAARRAGLDRDLHARHHAGRPDPVRAAVRALPQPRARDDARHRHGLRGRAARRGDPLRHAASTAPTTSPRSSRSARCSPGPRSATSAGCSGYGYGEVDRIAKAVPEPARHHARRGARDQRRRCARCTRATQPSGGCIDMARAPRGRRPQRLHPRRRRRHQPRAADRADAAPAGDELGRADDPVRDARRRGARPAQVRLPGAVEPHDPAPGRRLDPRSSAASRSTSTRSRSTTPRRSSCSHRARRPACSSLSRRACAATSGSSDPTSVYDLAAMVALYRPGPDGQHPGLHPPQARPGAGDVPPPAAGAVPEEDLRDLRLPGGHHGRRDGARRLHRARGGHARLRDPEEEVDRSCARSASKFVTAGRRARRAAAASSTRSSRPSSRSSATASTRPTPRATA